MTAYVVMIRKRTTDAAELALYRELAPLARQGHDIAPAAFYGPHEVLEGAPFEGAAILRFATMEAARGWYESPAYTAARAHRLAGSDTEVFLIEGVETEPEG